MWDYFDKFANYMGATYDRQDIDTRVKHKSYSIKQLKIIQNFNLKFMPHGPDYSKNYYIRKIQRWLRMIPRYIVLYAARLVPENMVSDEPLIPQHRLNQIAEDYQEDWEKCREYARKNNPL